MDKYVLIIAENGAWLRDVSFTLSQQSFKTELATSDSEGLLAAITFCPDVVIVEAGVGRIDGCQVAKALRALPETRDIVILAIVNSSTQTSVYEKSCDFDSAIASNAAPEKVVSALHAAFAGRSLQGPNLPFTKTPATVGSMPFPAIKNPHKLPLAAHNPNDAPHQPIVSDKHANLFAKWPTTKWFAIPHSMAEAMAATGAEILTAEEMIHKKLVDKSGPSGG